MKDLQWAYSQFPFNLNEKQDAFCRSFVEGKGHYLLNGLAGSGKSVVMEILKHYYGDEIVFFASSGVANLSLPNEIGDGTGHSGLSLPTRIATDYDHKKVSSTCSEMFAKSDLVKIIVIDECYGYNSDTLDVIWRRIKRFNKKSGRRKRRDIRLLLVGDPAQQITITNTQSKKELTELWGSHLMFDSTVWSRFNFTVCVFDKVERQDDPVFKACLDVIRYAQDKRYPRCLHWLNKRVDYNYSSDKLVLAATNKTVLKINEAVLNRNTKPHVQFNGVQNGEFDMRDVLVQKDITLAVGLRVMTVVNDNIEKRYVNGSQGVITKVVAGMGVDVLFDNGQEHFIEYKTWENKEYYIELDVKQEDGTVKDEKRERILGTLTSIPLLQASAITISKSQGLSISSPFVIDLESTWIYENLEDFGTNFTYVALSRGVNIGLITLANNVQPQHIKPCYQSIAFWHKCVEESVI